MINVSGCELCPYIHLESITTKVDLKSKSEDYVILVYHLSLAKCKRAVAI